MDLAAQNADAALVHETMNHRVAGERVVGLFLIPSESALVSVKAEAQSMLGNCTRVRDTQRPTSPISITRRSANIVVQVPARNCRARHPAGGSRPAKYPWMHWSLICRLSMARRGDAPESI